MQTLLEVHEVSFRYGGKQALDQLAFTVEAGSFHALLGPNGAGKSTLFGLISRLLPLQQGAIRIAGDNLQSAESRLLAKIGMVFQQSALDLDLTVRQNLCYHAALQGIGWRQRRQRIEAELQRVGLGERTDTRVRALNGGHRRRVEIARALLHQPQLLLLDEPSVGLDPHARADLNRHVRQLCRDEGIGVLWATHLMEEIAPRDPLTLIHHGRLLANCEAAELCQQTDKATLAEAFDHLTRPIQPDAEHSG